jgi:phage shock protein PspC (stress-responsive transcriptional regulator)
MITGLCKRLERITNIPTILFRIGFVISAMSTFGTTLIVYIIMAIFIND